MGIISLLVAKPCVGWMGEDGFHWEFQKAMGDLKYGSVTDLFVLQENPQPCLDPLKSEVEVD